MSASRSISVEVFIYKYLLVVICQKGMDLVILIIERKHLIADYLLRFDVKATD